MMPSPEDLVLCKVPPCRGGFTVPGPQSVSLVSSPAASDASMCAGASRPLCMRTLVWAHVRIHTPEHMQKLRPSSYGCGCTALLNKRSRIGRAPPPGWPKLCPNLAKFGRSWAKFGRIWSGSGKFGLNRTNGGRSRAKLSLGRARTTFGAFRLNSGLMCGRCRAKVGRVWTSSAVDPGAKIGRARSKLGRFRATLGRCWSSLADLGR